MLSSTLEGRAWLRRFNDPCPSNDLLPGRSRTRKDGSGGLTSSSRAFPEVFRRGKPFGILIGIEKNLQATRLLLQDQDKLSIGEIGTRLVMVRDARPGRAQNFEDSEMLSLVVN